MGVHLLSLGVLLSAFVAIYEVKRADPAPG